jgi:uncharacterized membrane protein YbaN (DUF454 family)
LLLTKFIILSLISYEAVDICINTAMLRSFVFGQIVRSWRKLCAVDLEEVTSAIYPSYHSERSHPSKIFLKCMAVSKFLKFIEKMSNTDVASKNYSQQQQISL